MECDTLNVRYNSDPVFEDHFLRLDRYFSHINLILIF